MTGLRAWVSALLTERLVTSGWFSIWTGLVLLYVAYLLGTVSPVDAVAPYTAVIAAALGLWQLGSGVRAEVRRAVRSGKD